MYYSFGDRYDWAKHAGSSKEEGFTMVRSERL